MKRFHLLGFLLLAIVAGGVTSVLLKSRTVDSVAAQGGIAWEPSIQTAMNDAKKSHKVLFLDFYADWCEYCQAMEKTSYRDPGVIHLSRGFVMAKVNVDKHQLLTRYFKVDGLPTLVFAKPSEGEITRLEGYIPPSELAHVMTEIETRLSKHNHT